MAACLDFWNSRQDLEMTYAELLGQATSFAGTLTSQLGYTKGDKLAVVLGGNCAESLVVQLGAAFAGVTVVTATEPADAKLVGCRGLVVSDHVLVDAQHPEGILAGEKHPPILCHDDTGVGSACANLFFQAVVDARPIAEAESDPDTAHAAYNGAAPVTQGAIVQVATVPRGAPLPRVVARGVRGPRQPPWPHGRAAALTPSGRATGTGGTRRGGVPCSLAVGQPLPARAAGPSVRDGRGARRAHGRRHARAPGRAGRARAGRGHRGAWLLRLPRRHAPYPRGQGGRARAPRTRGGPRRRQGRRRQRIRARPPRGLVWSAAGHGGEARLSSNQTVNHRLHVHL
jgi:hypothetical protein